MLGLVLVPKLPLSLLVVTAAMTISSTDTILSLLEAHPLQLERYEYGTAGFRYAATVMGPVMVRVGLVARFLLEERAEQQTQPAASNMGVMITASHNDESYNGVKISNPDGSMIGQDQEALLVQWVNERNLDTWKHKLLQLVADPSSTITTTTTTKIGSLHVGRDTRSHSLEFANLLMQAAKAMSIPIMNHGVVTTPMLHHVVLHSNTGGGGSTLASRQGYLQQLAQAYMELDQLLLLDLKAKTMNSNPNNNNNDDNDKVVLPALQVDGACGVGYVAMVDFQKVLVSHSDSRQHQATYYANRFQPRNPPSSGPLNQNCGSEHVQKQLQPPIWYDSDTINTTTATGDASLSNQYDYCCSVDGDADRIVFFKATQPWTLLDGDKIAVLIAHFFQTLLQIQELPQHLTLGVVQTAYANGASTTYLQEKLQVPVIITKTGVKHLHHAAMQFDIGIYFEANGHGTVLFSSNYHQATTHSPLLQCLPKLINPAVGDALSDLLLVDLLLRYFDWTLPDWNAQLYTDLPSRQLKVSVQDRTCITCNDNETLALTPPTLQPLLDQAMKAMQTNHGRCFVRPSGTENVVRIYAEASTRLLADQLATQAAQIVYETCQGIGPVPKI